jgi:hypothetical protein
MTTDAASANLLSIANSDLLTVSHPRLGSENAAPGRMII